MAERRRRYSTYGSVAYQPAYAPDPERRGARRGAEPQRRPQVQPRENVGTRPEAAVRQQSPVSLFAIVGFAAAALCVFLLLSAGAQLAVVSDETIDLRNELSELETEAATLQAQYEQAYDLAAIEKELTANGTMVKANSANTVYLDLSEADSVIYYEQAAAGIPGFVDRLEELFKGLLS